MTMKFLTSEDHFVTDSFGSRGIVGTQTIDHDFLAGLRDTRTNSANVREGEMHRVASVPVAVVDKWLREGFDIFKETPRAIVARLNAEDLGVFITTSKAV
jgi:hypothetical protein